ncbi:MAG: alpha/beta fold hydrolase [Stellaceae bacterium]
MPYCAVNGIDLYHESHGEGRPVVFAHGSGGNHASWFYQLLAVSAICRAITFDHRGFGKSVDKDNRGRSAMVDDLAGLLDHLEIRRAVLVAQSMGGGTCAGYTVRHPDRVAGLVLCDTLTGVKLPPDVAPRMAEVSKGTAGLPQAIRVLGPKTRERFPERATLYAQLASFNTHRFGATPGNFTPVEPVALAATGVPILYIVGSDDILYPPDCIRGVQALVPNSTLIEIPDVGHSAYYEDPASFNRHLADFLARLPE